MIVGSLFWVRPVTSILLIASLSYFFCFIHFTSSYNLALAQSLSSGITLSTNERIYTTGENVVVRGIVHPPVVAGNLLLLTILTPDNEFYRQDKSEITRDGVFTRNWSLPPDAQPGEWTVRGLFADKEGEITFVVMEPDTGFDRLVIDGLILTDSQGNAIDARDSLKTDHRIQIGGKLISDEEESDQPFILIAQIIDNQTGTTVSVKLTTGTLLAGQTASPSTQWTPVKEGEYVIEVFVWTSLNSPNALVQKQILNLDVV